MAADDRPLRTPRRELRRRAIAHAARRAIAPTRRRARPRSTLGAMPHVQLGGVDLHYEQHGSGDDVLLLCGLGDDHTAWDAQVAELPRPLPLTVVDNRGVGQSRCPTARSASPTWPRDAAALLDHLGIARAHVAGFSMGGAIAQELALARPDLVRSLVLVGTWARGDRFVNSRLREHRLDGRHRRRRPLASSTRSCPGATRRRSTRTAASTRSSRPCWPTRTRRSTEAFQRSARAPARPTTRSTGSAPSRRRRSSCRGEIDIVPAAALLPRAGRRHPRRAPRRAARPRPPAVPGGAGGVRRRSSRATGRSVRLTTRTAARPAPRAAAGPGGRRRSGSGFVDAALHLAAPARRSRCRGAR